MRIFQILPTLATGDGVGNDAVAMDAALREAGFDTQLYAASIIGDFPEGMVLKFNDLRSEDVRCDDVILYHLSIGSYVNYRLAYFDCRLIVVYHNITPPQFFEDYSRVTAMQCQYGLQGAAFLAGYADYCIADSEWNKNDLLDMGYSCSIDVVPIIIPFEDYRAVPNKKVLDIYRSCKGANILFAGRVAPNKCQHDVVCAFAVYKERYDPDARLFLVGSFNQGDAYGASLLAYIEALDVNDVVIPGHIGFDEILSYYTLADVFLCQSEHEGFCIPLLEAMLFDVPVVAYGTTAITETLGASGILMQDKNPLETAGVIDHLMKHAGIRDQVILGQRKRVQNFAPTRVKEQFIECVRRFLRCSS